MLNNKQHKFVYVCGDDTHDTETIFYTMELLISFVFKNIHFHRVYTFCYV